MQRLNIVVQDACELLRLEFVDGAASHRDIALVPRIGSVARMSLQDVARTLVDDHRSKRRDRCNWSGRWATLTWTMTAVRPRPFFLLKPSGCLCNVRPPQLSLLNKIRTRAPIAFTTAASVTGIEHHSEQTLKSLSSLSPSLCPYVMS